MKPSSVLLKSNIVGSPGVGGGFPGPASTRACGKGQRIRSDNHTRWVSVAAAGLPRGPLKNPSYTRCHRQLQPVTGIPGVNSHRGARRNLPGGAANGPFPGTAVALLLGPAPVTPVASCPAAFLLPPPPPRGLETALAPATSSQDPHPERSPSAGHGRRSSCILMR